ncbi:major histocompatibility complex class I-related gene protein-like isoform X2 [Hemicordylus capensis]|uniref:major histocompatibility complex class I-related gene protein-like isoform X2 n=1 Tax=Hemicordylus capensis TaxID=884348 RepID=UPI002303EF31|nr:major histocompatibility complex class I-related gene protein-like isoform X2 [Hemicordylus capensis]
MGASNMAVAGQRRRRRRRGEEVEEGSSSHSLYLSHILVSEPIQGMPQFIAFAYVDDQLIGHYDSNRRRCLPDVPWMKKAEEEDASFWDWTTKRVKYSEMLFRGDLLILQKHYNHSRGLHTWQRVFGCEVSEEGRQRGYYRYAYDGRDFISLDRETLTWIATDTKAEMVKRKWEAEPSIFQGRRYFMEEECTKFLQKFLEYGKQTLLRTEQPIVKVNYDGLETLICHAHGFYPKEIDAVWRKDGEVWEHETFRGGVTPNSDGTYHTWLSVKVNPKDRSHYQCHVEHGSLTEPLVFCWEEPASVLLGVIVVSIFAILVAVLLMVGIVCYTLSDKEAKRNQDLNSTS